MIRWVTVSAVPLKLFCGFFLHLGTIRLVTLIFLNHHFFDLIFLVPSCFFIVMKSPVTKTSMFRDMDSVVWHLFGTCFGCAFVSGDIAGMYLVMISLGYIGLLIVSDICSELALILLGSGEVLLAFTRSQRSLMDAGPGSVPHAWILSWVVVHVFLWLMLFSDQFYFPLQFIPVASPYVLFVS